MYSIFHNQVNSNSQEVVSPIVLIPNEPAATTDVENNFLPDDDNLVDEYSDNEFVGGVSGDDDSSSDDESDSENDTNLASSAPLKKIYKQTKTVGG